MLEISRKYLCAFLEKLFWIGPCVMIIVESYNEDYDEWVKFKEFDTLKQAKKYVLKQFDLLVEKLDEAEIDDISAEECYKLITDYLRIKKAKIDATIH
jgi:hypothetical protein